MKTAGRDAGKKCIIVDVLDRNFVLVDGQTRRRKCSLSHLEPLEQVAEIVKNAGNKEVVLALKNLGITVEEKKQKDAAGPKPAKPTRIRNSVVKAKEKIIKQAEEKSEKSSKKKPESESQAGQDGEKPAKKGPKKTAKKTDKAKEKPGLRPEAKPDKKPGK
jgi:large subunit ribosomal protein L14e